MTVPGGIWLLIVILSMLIVIAYLISSSNWRILQETEFAISAPQMMRFRIALAADLK